MHVGLHVPRHVEVDHVRDSLDVQAPRGHVRREHKGGLVRHEGGQSGVAIVLGLVPMDLVLLVMKTDSQVNVRTRIERERKKKLWKPVAGRVEESRMHGYCSRCSEEEEKEAPKAVLLGSRLVHYRHGAEGLKSARADVDAPLGVGEDHYFGAVLQGAQEGPQFVVLLGGRRR